MQSLSQTILGDLFSQDAGSELDLVPIQFYTIGLISAEAVVGNTCYPIRGAFLQVINDNQDFDKVSIASVISADGAVNEFNEMVFIIPWDEKHPTS